MHSHQRKPISILLISLFLLFTGAQVRADADSEKAWKIHKRLTGMNPSPTQLAALKSALMSQGVEGAARISVEDDQFINGLVFRYAAQSVSKNDDIFYEESASDATMLIQYAILKNWDFREILNGNRTAWMDPNMIGVLFNPQEGPVNVQHVAYHYQDRGGAFVALMNNVNFARVMIDEPLRAYPAGSLSHPDAPPEIDNIDRAGVLSTRGFGRQNLAKGTNRQGVKKALRAFACRDITDVRDGSFSNDVLILGQIHADVGRNNTQFRAVCSSCHGALDPLTKAFGYFDYTSGFILNSRHATMGSPGVVEKMRHDSQTGGTLPSDSLWTNNLKTENFGWNESLPLSGNGLKEFGNMIAQSHAFATCTVKRFYELICKRKPTDAESPLIENLAGQFKTTLGYKVKPLAAKIAGQQGCIVE